MDLNVFVLTFHPEATLALSKYIFTHLQISEMQYYTVILQAGKILFSVIYCDYVIGLYKIENR